MIETHSASISCSLCSKNWLMSDLQILPLSVSRSHLQLSINCYLINSAFRKQNSEFANENTFEVICPECYKNSPLSNRQFQQNYDEQEHEKLLKIEESLRELKRQNKRTLFQMSSLKEELQQIKLVLGESGYESIKQTAIFHGDAQVASNYLQSSDNELFDILAIEMKKKIEETWTRYQQNLLGKIEDSIEDQMKRQNKLRKLIKSSQKVKIDVLKRDLDFSHLQESDNLSDFCMAKIIQVIRNIESLENLRERMWNYLLEGTCTYPDY